ncbi:MAG: leucine-rich repeat domain-containing protein, partial [Thermoplasmata archaeon]|nr:leucine-rich repeat domain-containing protein [Thermoplasmata archaeon]
MNRNRVLTGLAILLLLGACLVWYSDEASGSDPTVTLYVGTYLDVQTVDVKCGESSTTISLEKDNTYGFSYGKAQITVSAGSTVLCVEECESYNGTKTIISAGQDSYGYLWLTNYSVNESTLTGTSNSTSFSLDLKTEGDAYNVSWSESNGSTKVSVGISEYLTISGKEYHIVSADLSGKIAISHMAFVNISGASAGGTVSGSTPNPQSGSTKNTDSVVLWNSQTNDSKFLAFCGLDLVWLMDADLGKEAFAYDTQSGYTYSNNSSSKAKNSVTIWVGGDLDVESWDGSFAPAPYNNGKKNQDSTYSVVVLTDDFDYVGLLTYLSQVKTLATKPAKVAFSSLVFNCDSIRGYESGSNGLTVSKISMTNVKQVGSYAFYGISGEIEATDNLNSVESIGSYAFAETAIQSINLNSVKSIGAGAFANCSKLSSITIGGSLDSNCDLLSVFSGA